jgi:hypothetical protein
MDFALHSTNRPASVPAARAWLRPVLMVFVCLLPVLLTFSLMTVYAGGQPVLPALSDEVLNWHQVATLLKAGLNGGYYTLFEQPAPLEAFHYYAYGPWPYLVYAPFGLAGWGMGVFPLLNTLLMGLALAAFQWMTRPGLRQVSLLAVLVVAFAPALLYYPVAMQETLNHALAVVVAGVFVVLYRRRGGASAAIKLGGLVLILLMTLLRSSWAMLLLPYCLLILPPRRWSVVLAVGVTGLVAVAFLQFIGLTAAPYNAPGVNAAFGDSVGGYLLRVIRNFVYYLDPGKPLFDFVFTIQTVVLLIVMLLALRRRGRPPGALDRAEAFFHLYVVGGMLGAVMVMYISGELRDYRVMSGHVLISLLVLLAHRRYLLLILFIVSSLVFLPATLQFYGAIIGMKTSVSTATMTSFETTIAPFVVYDPGQPDAWCNTLMTTSTRLGSQLLTLPPGVGISFFFKADDPLAMRSRYWLVDTATAADLMRLHPGYTLRPVAETSLGTLYLNEGNACSSPGL